MAVPDTIGNLRLHADDDLRRSDGVQYQCKFEGSYRVSEPKGLAMVQRACDMMREGKGKRKDAGVKQAPMVAMHISDSGIQVFSGEEVVTRTHMLNVPIDKISYIARDPNNRHYLAVIYETAAAKETEPADYECTLFKHDVAKTREIVLTLNQAFDLAYQKRVKEGKIPSVTFKEQIEIYRSRLKQLSEQLPSDKLADFLRLLNISEVTEIRGLQHQSSAQAQTLGDVAAAQAAAATAQSQAPPAAVRTTPATLAGKAAPPAPPTTPTPKATPTVAASQSAEELILDVGAKVNTQQQQHVDDPFGGDAFSPPPPPQRQQQQQQQQRQQQDLMRLGFSSSADLEFDPLKM